MQCMNVLVISQGARTQTQMTCIHPRLPGGSASPCMHRRDIAVHLKGTTIPSTSKRYQRQMCVCVLCFSKHPHASHNQTILMQATSNPEVTCTCCTSNSNPVCIACPKGGLRMITACTCEQGRCKHCSCKSMCKYLQSTWAVRTAQAVTNFVCNTGRSYHSHKRLPRHQAERCTPVQVGLRPTKYLCNSQGNMEHSPSICSDADLSVILSND